MNVLCEPREFLNEEFFIRNSREYLQILLTFSQDYPVTWSREFLETNSREFGEISGILGMIICNFRGISKKLLIGKLIIIINLYFIIEPQVLISNFYLEIGVHVVFGRNSQLVSESLKKESLPRISPEIDGWLLSEDWKHQL